MAGFDFVATPLPGLLLVEREAAVDSRGFFARLFSAEEFRAVGWARPIAQINHTNTRLPGAVRGLHFQRPPHAEMKLVSCVRGSVFDVAVDLRKGSATFLRWHGTLLSAANRRGYLIPEGFAHGFQALEADCELIYLHSVAYAAQSEEALNALDPRLGIEWPVPVTQRSDRDVAHAFVDSAFAGIAQ